MPKRYATGRTPFRYIRKACVAAGMALYVLSVRHVWAFEDTEILFDSRGDFGGVGLLQTPTARFAPDGDLGFTSSRAYPYFRNTFSAQVLPSVEFALRYTTVQNRLYGPESFSGDQLYKDRGMDLKFKISDETPVLPSLALGFRDFLGTGLFSSEYIVANKRYENLDFSFGLAWGNLGARGQFKNPFSFFSDRFSHRNKDIGLGGNFSVNYFRGERASLFGGVSYRSNIPGLVLKLEYDGNDYQSEALGNVIPVKIPFNFGVVYSKKDWPDISIGFERGNVLMVQMSFLTNMHTVKGFPKFDPAPVDLKPRDLIRDVEVINLNKKNGAIASDDPVLLKMSETLSSQKIVLRGINVGQKAATIAISQGSYRQTPKAIGRAARVLSNYLPSDVEELNIVQTESSLPTIATKIYRKDLERALANQGSPEEIAAHAIVAPVSESSLDDLVGVLDYPNFDWSVAPMMRHHIGGPDSPYIYQIYLRSRASVNFSRNFSLDGSFGLDLVNNFSKLKLESDSVLPHVRSDIKHYFQEGKNGLFDLSASYLAKPYSNLYGRVSFGLLEQMFAGLSSEVLYRPGERSWAVGVDLNRVRQRGYGMDFSMRNYEVTTGHLSFYYQLPFYKTTAVVSIGQYLAGDKGATFELSRRFESGATLGGYFTKTNVSAAQFGEGSFDKGIFFSMPLDLITLFSTRGTMGFGWSPLTRDGGARLQQPKRLYGVSGDNGFADLSGDWGNILN